MVSPVVVKHMVAPSRELPMPATLVVLTVVMADVMIAGRMSGSAEGAQCGAVHLVRTRRDEDPHPGAQQGSEEEGQSPAPVRSYMRAHLRVPSIARILHT